MVIKRLFLILSLISILSVFNSCGYSEYEYDEDYWKSVQREKTMRKSGLYDLADHEADLRQNRLIAQKKSNTQRISPVSFAVTTMGVVIFIGFIFVVVHISTKDANEESCVEQDISSPKGNIVNREESIEDVDVIEKLERLANLKDRGAITDDEFDNEKRKLLKQ